jgi:ribonuclease BN (tRNA processing enzyme)
MRISAGGSTIAYSADTGISDELVKLARDVDLFVCEASYLHGDSNPPDIHLTGREAGEHARRAEVGSLLLTHLVPWGDRERTLAEATEVYDGEVAVASTGAVFDV